MKEPAVNWQLHKLGDILELEYGKPLPKNMRSIDGKFPVYGANGIKCLTDHFYCDKPTIIVGRKGTAGAINISKQKFWPLDVTYFVHFDDQKYDLQFLYYCLLNLNLPSLAKGVKPGLNRNEVYEIKTLIPPLSEQKYIVSILDEVFEGIGKAVSNAEKNLKNSQEMFESHINKLFRNKSADWIETSLKNEIELLTGFAFKSEGYTEDKNGIGLLRGDNIMQGYFRWRGVKRWPPNDIYSYSKYCLKENDVVLAMDRTWVKSGLKFAQISKEDLPCLLVQRVARLRAKDGLDKNFLKYLIGSNLFLRYVLSIQTGLGVPHISGKQIQNFIFHKPDIETQKMISKNLNKFHNHIQKLEKVYHQKLKSMEELKQSILQKAFTGKLTAKTVDKIMETV